MARDRSHDARKASARPYERAASNQRTPPCHAASSTSWHRRSNASTDRSSPRSSAWLRLMYPGRPSAASPSPRTAGTSLASGGGAAVDPEQGAGGVARGVAGEVDGGAHDLGRVADPPEDRVRRRPRQRALVPRRGRVGGEGTRQDAVHPHRGPEGVGKGDG